MSADDATQPEPVEMIGGQFGFRPMRTCAGCHQTDDHPRCEDCIDFANGIWASWHHDCHQDAVGPADCHPECADGSHAGKTGLAMLQHILAHGAARLAEESALTPRKEAP